MSYEAKGSLTAVFDTVQRSEKFRTREFVIEVTEEIRDRTITNYVKFQLVQDRTAILDRFQVGDTVKVHFNLRGSRWERNGQVNYITNLDAWRLESVLPQPSSTGDGMPAFSPDPPGPSEAPDDLPF
ncbi:MAG: DUF3127 domain-containing protein [Bacteroidetes bacterium]|nr:DUF3127 domain-containing protein [Bacteroidota bacterium]